MLSRLIAISLFALSCHTNSAEAQSYPQRPIRIVVPFAAGDGTDVMGRLVGQKLTEAFRVQSVIENRMGAGGNIGADVVAKAAPDGYTLLVVTEALAINAAMQTKLPYDLIKDFEAISMLGRTPLFLVVHPSVSAKTVRELVLVLKANPDKLTCASGGNGSLGNFACVLFDQMAGTKMTHVPYKGSGPAITDLVAGHLSYGFFTYPTAAQQFKAGRLRVLATTTEKRAAFAPDIPTVAESGVPGFAIFGWQAILAPKGTPKPVIERLNAEITKALKDPGTADKMLAQGIEPWSTTPAEAAEFIRGQVVKFRQIAKTAGLKAE